ncbi:peptide-binding protein [Desulfocurvibacter africanus]|uniref:peptide-binding protein n=1 Tax=Desulfocurvibacter africanus TaxID=873 RepID=UPI002FDAEA34
MHPRRTILAVLAVFSILSLACGPSDTDEQGKPAAGGVRPVPGVAEIPVRGGRIVEPTLGEPSNLIAALSTDSASHEVADLIYVAPLRYNKDIELEPWAAESFEVLEDGKLLRFKLREDIRWFDGTPFTAADVKFTVDLMRDPKTPTAYSDDYLAIKKFTVTGPYSFEVRYDKPFARSLVTWALDVLPKHALEKENLLETKYSRMPMGAGPYKLKEWVPGRRIVLEANDDYFLGRPYLDQVIYEIIPDLSTQFLELKAGNLDTMGLTAQQYLFQTKGPDWERNWNKFEYLSFGYTFLGYNLKHPLFQSNKVRQALSCAIDTQEIVKGVLFGLGQPAMGPYKPGTWVYNDKLAPYAYDPERAKRLLAEEGWRDSNGDGLLDKNGQAFKFTILTNQGNEQRIKTATIIQQRLKQVGVAVDIRTVEWAAFANEFLNKGNFEATLLGWNILQDPDIFTVWHSSQFPPAGLNLTYYKNEELDRLLEEGRMTLDQEERKRIYDRVQEILHEDQPYTFLYVPMALPIVHARFRNVEVAPAGITHNFTEWWVPTHLQR